MDLVTLAKSKVLDENKEMIPLHSLWKQQTAILIFMRHFACITCRVHAKEVWAHRDRYEDKGAKVFFIGNGSPNFIQGFKEDLGIEDAPIFTDPTLESFRAAGFRRGFLSCLGPRAFLNARRAKKAHNLPKKYEEGMGDLWQVGGIVTISPEGRLVFHHINEVLGDYPPHEDPFGGN